MSVVLRRRRGQSAELPRPGAWILAGVRHAGRPVLVLAAAAEPACRSWRWVPAAIAIGIVPFLASIGTGVPGHQLVSAALLSWLCLNLARHDATTKGVGAITLAFVAHSVAVIAVANQWPDLAASQLPGAGEYWDKQIAWIETGVDPEYEWSAWIPAHCTLLAGTTLFSFTSFGLVTFYEGLQQVDLMNFYNARLLGVSASRPVALALGWHLWSMCRGIGYVFLTFEIISMAVATITGVAVSRWKTRMRRWAAGLSFLLLDGIIKAMMLETVRTGLNSNLG